MSRKYKKRQISECRTHRNQNGYDNGGYEDGHKVTYRKYHREKGAGNSAGMRLLTAVITVSLIIAGVRIYSNAEEQREQLQLQEGIAKEIIRFHVRANSDSEEDQSLKLQVKDAVVSYMQPLLADSSDISESRDILSAHTEDIKEVALSTLSEAGSNAPVNVYFEQSYFPMKSYGDVTFPPGTYEAFRVDIGAHEGKNWWCVLYPPLCFVDAVYGVVPEESKEQLSNVLTEEEYDAVTGGTRSSHSARRSDAESDGSKSDGSQSDGNQSDGSKSDGSQSEGNQNNGKIQFRFKYLTFLNGLL